MEKLSLIFDKKFFKHALLQACAYWVFHVMTSSLQYYLGGENYLHFENGEIMSAWQYFLNFDMRLERLLLFLTFGFCVELNHRWANQRVNQSFLKTLITSFFFTFFIALFYALMIFKQFQLKVIPELIVMPIIIFTFYSLGYHYIRNEIDNQRKTAEKRYQKSQAELDVLKAQLNPHFFFNALNNLYGTALNENAPKTVGLIEQLSSIMRYTMGEAQNPFTDVKNEWNFIENYWDLQEIRLPKREGIKLSKSLFFDEKPTQIAPLLLIPFIENAFKYGVSVDHDCEINLDLSVKNQQLTMTLSNTIQKEKTFDVGNGIGIGNTKKRLDLIYGNQYVLTQSQESNIYKVVLTIQLT